MVHKIRLRHSKNQVTPRQEGLNLIAQVTTSTEMIDIAAEHRLEFRLRQVIPEQEAVAAVAAAVVILGVGVGAVEAESEPVARLQLRDDILILLIALEQQQRRRQIGIPGIAHQTDTGRKPRNWKHISSQRNQRLGCERCWRDTALTCWLSQ